MITKKPFIYFFALVFTSYLFAQKQHEQIFIDAVKVKIAEHTSNKHFQKASHFFIEKIWDSTLVHSAKQLNLNTNLELNNYCHYYRGVSFQLKKIFKEAEKEFEQISTDFIFYPLVRMILGEIALEREQYQKALNYFKEIENIKDIDKFGIVASIIEDNIGVCYIHLEKYDKAEVYLLKRLQVQGIEKDTMQLIGIYGNIANSYYNQYKDNKAIPYFEKAHTLSKALKVKSVRSFSLKSEAARNMSIVEENRKDFAKALAYRKEFEKWTDSLNNQNKIWETAQREKQDAIKEKQKEVIVLEADNKTKIAERNGFIYSSIILLILLGTGTYFYREKVKSNKTIATQKETLNELNATKDYLFSVVSHDLRSPVNALRKQHKKLKNQIAKNDLDSLEKTIDTSTTISESMYGLLNNVLHWSLEQSNQLLFRQEKLALKPIIEHVVYDFENLASAKAISLETTLDSTIAANFDRESLKIVLRNLLDNAVKYTDEYGKIHIQTTATAHESIIEVTDTGKGFSSAQIEKINDLTTITMEKIDRSKGVGLGLLLCVTLIKKNKGVFSIEQNNPKGSIIKITLPKT
ncbi:ATP-binding protein [Kordia sp.]|uniref:ATP-binding protein n=1 Tax=Kordia sp. TaxID=1965332 RepID=UPI003D6A3CFE